MVFLLNKNDAFYRAIGGFSMPETIIINNNGAIVLHKRGPLRFEEMKAEIKKVLIQN